MTNLPLASIPGTEVRVLHSGVVDQDYLISVALPVGYTEHPDKRYPVIYVLDGNWYFGMVTDMVRAMNIRVPFWNELPDALIVGIGYPVEGSLAEQLHQVMHLRMRDFLPVRNEEDEQFIQEHFPVPAPLEAGNAEQFLQFISQDLVPLIESEYRVDPASRTLLGHSWGGCFAFYTLFRQPHLFQQYVIASSGPYNRDELSYAENHDSLPVRMHLVWDIEMDEPDLSNHHISEATSLVNTLESRRDTGLRLSHQFVSNCTHCAVVPPAFQAGLVAVFSSDE